MTDVARHLLMWPGKSKARFVVVKNLLLQPCILGMTRAALPAEIPFVLVISFVTSKARRRRLAVRRLRLVTLPTLHCLMCTVQREIRGGMIEHGCIELHDIGFAAFVIGVACFAFRVLDFLAFAMKAGLRTDIARNVFVAVQAKTPLAFLRVRLMTAITGRFPLRMR